MAGGQIISAAAEASVATVSERYEVAVASTHGVRTAGVAIRPVDEGREVLPLGARGAVLGAVVAVGAELALLAVPTIFAVAPAAGALGPTGVGGTGSAVVRHSAERGALWVARVAIRAGGAVRGGVETDGADIAAGAIPRVKASAVAPREVVPCHGSCLPNGTILVQVTGASAVRVASVVDGTRGAVLGSVE